MILKHDPKIVGVHRLIMKAGSDNFRESAVHDIINMIKEEGVEVIVYEPTLKGKKYCDCLLVNDLDMFKVMSSMIVTNRFSEELTDVKYKVYTRDLFGDN